MVAGTPLQWNHIRNQASCVLSYGFVGRIDGLTGLHPPIGTNWSTVQAGLCSERCTSHETVEVQGRGGTHCIVLGRHSVSVGDTTTLR